MARVTGNSIRLLINPSSLGSMMGENFTVLGVFVLEFGARRALTRRGVAAGATAGAGNCTDAAWQGSALQLGGVCSGQPLGKETAELFRVWGRGDWRQGHRLPLQPEWNRL